MAQSESSWLAIFPSLSNGMRLQMLSNLPPGMNNATMFNAIFALPYKERNTLINLIPRNTLRNMLIALPKNTQIAIARALTKVTANKKKSNSTNNTNKNNNNQINTNNAVLTNKLDIQNRDRNLKESLSSNGIFDNNLLRRPQSRFNTINGSCGKIKYSTNTKIKKQLNKLSNVNNNNNNNHGKAEYELVDAISDYNSDEDMDYDKCAIHIVNSRIRFNKITYLTSVTKMMRSFGDSPKPSRYSAFIILNHIKLYLKSVIKCIISLSDENNRRKRLKSKYKYKSPKPKSKTSKTLAIEYINICEKWFPSQVKIFKKWKSFKNESKKHNKNSKPPDNLTTDDVYDDKDDIDQDDDEEGKDDKEFINELRENNKDSYSVYIDDLNISIGWGARLIECDMFTNEMKPKAYFKYSKCRESTFTHNKNRFYHWLGIDEYHRLFALFLGFIAWDRVGNIIQISRAIKDIRCNDGINSGIIEEKNEFLTPTDIVTAILKINKIKDVTPISFEDISLKNIQINHIKTLNFKNYNKDKKNDKNTDKNKISGKKRSLNQIHDDKNDDNLFESTTHPPPKKIRLS